MPIALGLLFSTLLGVGILFMPESPRWLLAHGHREQAIRAIARLRGSAHDVDNAFVQDDLKEMEEAVNATSQQATWADCFRPQNKTLYRTLLLMVMQSIQQLTGANYFVRCSTRFVMLTADMLPLQFYYGYVRLLSRIATSPYSCAAQQFS